MLHQSSGPALLNHCHYYHKRSLQIKPHWGKWLSDISHHRLFGSNERTPAHLSDVGSQCEPWPTGGSPPPGPAPDGNIPSLHCSPGRPNAWTRPQEKVWKANFLIADGSGSRVHAHAEKKPGGSSQWTDAAAVRKLKTVFWHFKCGAAYRAYQTVEQNKSVQLLWVPLSGCCKENTCK